jgi:indole-3-glycerol phosphate synthase
VRARAVSGIPLLKKDFHVDVVQIYEARALGASAALVIVRAVDPKRLRELIDAGKEVELDILVEVRSEAELTLAISSGAEIIGVNNRDLETLQIDTDRAIQLIPRVPISVLAVAESGLKTASHVKRLAAAGTDAVLVGSELSASADPQTAVKSLTGIRRNASARKG